ncbi:MAG: hypothetical protein KAS75_00355 [Planctomycetes bacterium]|nr:hypothetical protein [Planctomycetota bacterium]
MAFWLGILVAAAFAWSAIKIGFYETWAMLFNIVIAVYLAVFIGPAVANIPAAANTPFGNIIAIAATAILAFAILQSISYLFITGHVTVPFPKIFDILGAAFLGFLAGFLVWSFASLLIFLTPISQNTFIKDIGFGDQFSQANIPYISWWCDLVNNVVAFEDNQYTTQRIIDGLVKSVEKTRTPKRIKKQPKITDPNKTIDPNENSEPNIPPQLKKPVDTNGL